MSKKIIEVLKFLFFLGIGSTILYFVYQKQDAAYQEECALKGISAEDCSLIGKVIEDITAADYSWLSLVFLVFIISNISRAIRWKMLIKPLGYDIKLANAFWATMLGYFANLGIPRVGEFVKAATLGNYEKIPFEKVMGTVVTDRIADVLSLAVVIGLALLVEYDTILSLVEGRTETPSIDGGSNTLSILWILIGIALTVAVLFFIFYQQIRTTALFQKVVGILQGFWEGIQTVMRLDKPGWFVFHSINIWFMYFLMMYFGLKAYDPVAHLDWQAALVLFVTGGLAFLIPAPGGMGSYHLMITEVCQNLYGIAGADGFSFANILFVFIQLFTNIVLGVGALIILPLINRKKE